MAFGILPPGLVADIEARTGPIGEVVSVSEGYNSQIAVRIRCASGTYFVKGLQSSHKRVWTQQREAEINPHLNGLSPALIRHISDHGWELLIFEALEGHHADYSAGSADLPMVATLLSRLSETPCPDLDLRPVDDRLKSYVTKPSDANLFKGEALVHTDPNDTNVIVTGSSAKLVDWAWASCGAAWLDAGYWVIWLMAAGKHDPASAEKWAGEVPAWREAPPEALTAFAEAKANYWDQVAGPDPDPFTANVRTAAQQWARYRHVL
ncbi:aminoglycoside phosphotransferase [Actinacidiphila acididurans]|uniref:Aminoglycoside phosphotransferase n=1 Tax=Actinacidiphila acididurans TaxID=2784346 RepID=A0ABS2TR80_9ACTN|nr:aminoglycoside phosphotransferase [Actinacidiphila acididurans]MBM9505844.1 aminoglycoside phosphotransferase [Actinacidiphila acididurans]